MPGLLDRIHDLYDELERRRVMLSFKGGLTPELITVLLALVERKLDGMEPDHKSRKRVFNVVVECLQNLYHHNGHLRLDDGAVHTTKEPHGVVMIARTESGYSVLTGNFMAGSEVEQLKGHLDRINSLNPDDLREWYRAKLADGTYSSAGGGGLGMIDIARRSGGKLEYAFVPYDKDSAFFSLNVNVNT
ncbi:MAG: SiaB family protein kinase [Flavobacteriales bacterium]|jgi:hypothetical protein|nr:MAG: SiaB family protein kinase [Flavobacteriales bacterium]